MEISFENYRLCYGERTHKNSKKYNRNMIKEVWWARNRIQVLFLIFLLCFWLMYFVLLFYSLIKDLKPSESYHCYHWGKMNWGKK